ncbi:DUF3624 domain-containing protein [Shewanella psychropiezotolerans]|uniref:DUF3624 domain-containing protein n=1 Tax=Shewanella psychropiezotolerans TaxID=2593655 RepID=A0ABX5X162_9GAMM|nr:MULTISPECIES: DUF3624 domain-containing protein [Shewanella]MPY21276.1 DUF3624 domain-containing protein [Shewanella sp. YLB-07]MPY22063.1 DUF3624 domain-containing protein [Shewanella sp. YLB-07]QDO85075.1 DUF3624 domain-containing protein [Shewanella psychropiezotolerans]
MTCNSCESSIFRQKLGRCKACMWQLAILSVIAWPLWWFLYSERVSHVESIALLFFCISFTGLLLLHLLVLGYRSLTHKT